MISITDEFMKQKLSETKGYTIIILKDGPNKVHEDKQKIIWEYGRRNFMLREEGLLSIVCPIRGLSNEMESEVVLMELESLIQMKKKLKR